MTKKSSPNARPGIHPHTKSKSLLLLNNSEIEDRLEGKIPFIVMEDVKLGQFVEKTYFPPGTKKNREFKEALLPTKDGKLLPIWLIWDTQENREILCEALTLFYGFKPTKEELDKGIDSMRDKIKEFVDQYFKGSQ